MKILLINGSPREENSNTLKITDAFFEGLCKRGQHDLKTVVISKQNIQPCKGCYGCWGYTPGICVLQDDMGDLLNLYRESDLIIWSFPLYYFGMPSGIKTFMDRLFPNNLPTMVEANSGGIRHPQRYDFSKQKHILISTCGFQSTYNNFEALEKQFDLMFGKLLVKITCPAGVIFGTNQPGRPIREYLEKVRNAGCVYGIAGTLSKEMQRALSKAIFEPEVCMKAQNLVMKTAGLGVSPSVIKPLNEKAVALMQKMQIEFTSQTSDKTPVVIEIYIDDFCNVFQFHVADKTCHLYTEHMGEYTTRIEVSFCIWEKIIFQKASIIQTFIDQKCKVFGDFNTILRFDDFFPVLPANHFKRLDGTCVK